jgi:2-amino-4-hydroxy-6-hydroxymethyldihydropteridine diphosphokinase
MPIVFVSVGSNVERERNIGSALQALHAHFGPLLLSGVYETEAVGFTGAPFFNLVAGFHTDAPPRATAEILSNIESEHGRARNSERFAPRTLDLDLLLYGEMVADEPGIQLPRPEIGSYGFVLEPLAEIAPDLKHPRTGESYWQMWDTFRGSSLPARAVKPFAD